MPSTQPRPASPNRPAPKRPPSRRPAPRRSSPSRSGASRTFDLTESHLKKSRARVVAPSPSARPTVTRAPQAPASNPNDPGVVRRARKKAETRRKMWLSLVVVAVVSTPVVGMTMGVWQRYNETRTSKLAPREAMLHDLQTRLTDRKLQLQALASPAGKERALVQNGFLREGERLLLFPKTSPEKASSSAKTEAKAP